MQFADITAKTADKIVPRIYVALPSTGAPTTTLAGEHALVQRSVVADLMVFYAFDIGTHYELISQKDLTRLGLTEDALHDTAIENLRALNLQVRANAGDGMYLLTAGGNSEATLLLLPEVWESVAPMVDGDLVVSVPARDAICFTGDATHENLAGLRRATSYILEQARHPLSRVFLRRIDGEWTEYSGFAE